MKKSQNEVTVGAFVIIGFILLALIVFFVSGVYVFRSGYYVTVNYNYVDILDKGAPVRMAGVRVGEVHSVSLVYDEKEKRAKVLVKLFIEKTAEIRENYSFEIRGTHVLSEPGSSRAPVPRLCSVKSLFRTSRSQAATRGSETRRDIARSSRAQAATWHASCSSRN